jgi:hypothetical protein
VIIVRHPLDVVISVAHHVARLEGRAPDEARTSALIREMVDLFVSTGGCAYDPTWEAFGTWFGHASSWRDQDEIPAMLVRYEDLSAAPQEVLTRICRFAEFHPGEAAIRNAVEMVQFKFMAEMERREISNAVDGVFNQDTSGSPRIRFVRRGRFGQWHDHLSAEQRALVRIRYGAQMARFGYEV